ncbi:MAG: RNA polymerase sigma factor region1.1 domain-containing protein [Pyrinomonadaceae bacterium]
MKEKDQDDAHASFVGVGRRQKYLTFDDLNRELPDNMVSPEDIEDVLQAGAVKYSCRRFRRTADRTSSRDATSDEESDYANEEDVELNLSCPERSNKTNDPVRLYHARNGCCAADFHARRRSDDCQKNRARTDQDTQSHLTRSPIAVRELLRMGDSLMEGSLNIREVVTFSEQAELTGIKEDKADDYLQWTIEGIENAIQKLFKSGSRVGCNCAAL